MLALHEVSNLRVFFVDAGADTLHLSLRHLLHEPDLIVELVANVGEKHAFFLEGRVEGVWSSFPLFDFLHLLC